MEIKFYILFNDGRIKDHMAKKKITVQQLSLAVRKDGEPQMVDF